MSEEYMQGIALINLKKTNTHVSTTSTVSTVSTGPELRGYLVFWRSCHSRLIHDQDAGKPNQTENPLVNMSEFRSIFVDVGSAGLKSARATQALATVLS